MKWTLLMCYRCVLQRESKLEVEVHEVAQSFKWRGELAKLQPSRRFLVVVNINVLRLFVSKNDSNLLCSRNNFTNRVPAEVTQNWVRLYRSTNRLSECSIGFRERWPRQPDALTGVVAARP